MQIRIIHIHTLGHSGVVDGLIGGDQCYRGETRILFLLYAAATSAPLADDGFRQRLALDGDRLIVGIIVIDVEGGVGEAGDEASRHQLLIKLVGVSGFFLAGRPWRISRLFGGRRGAGFFGSSDLLVELRRAAAFDPATGP